MSALLLFQVAGLALVGSVVLALLVAALLSANGRTDRRAVLAGALARDVSSAVPPERVEAHLRAVPVAEAAPVPVPAALTEAVTGAEPEDERGLAAPLA